MRRGTGWRIGIILAVTVAAALLLTQTPLNLGLDLQGGVHVVLEGQAEDGQRVSEDMMQRATAVIERRVNALGVAEPLVQRQGDRRIIVELPGVHDQQQAIDTIGRTAQLEFKDPHGNTVVTGAYLESARIGADRYGRPSVDIRFNREGAQLFAEMTTRYQGQTSQIVLDDEVLQEVMIREPILEGEGQITGTFTHEEARHLAVLLQGGALPVPMDIMEIRNVGPTLGQDSIDRSLRAGLIGILFVLLYMVFYYKMPGAISAVALVIYVVIVLAVLAGLRATLTLPGIAGFILSIGMAVDANVIIFERIKEELNSGKRLRPSIETGFNRAFKAIFDANVTTLITAVVLFYFGTSVVRGFAVTLSIGILASMFTAIVITRVLLTAVADSDPEKMTRYFAMRGVSQ